MPKVHPATDTGPGRLGRGRRVSTSLSEINVVPLVDVMLVLLIIFMVTAPMIQRGIDVRLPVSTRAAQVSGERVYITVPTSRCASTRFRSACGSEWSRRPGRKCTCRATAAWRCRS
jgi:hypothetical protein